jgi:hypothetical protein
MKDIDEILSHYTRNELNIYSKEDYAAMLRRWSNDEDLVIYRGINFPNKAAHDKFLEEFEKNSGYLKGHASGFAKTKETAQDFASTTKTYFPTLEVMERESARSAMFEEITGYGGIILKAIAKKGEVVDVTKSPHAIEDEVLFAPGKLIKCEIEHVRTYKQTVGIPDFDKNKYIQNNDIDSGLSKYIIGNHAKQLSSKSKNYILEQELSLLEKSINKFQSTKDLKEVDKGQYWLAYSLDNFNYDRKSKEFEKTSELRFLVPDFKTQDLHGLWSPAQLKKIKEVSSEIIYSVLQVHLEYRDKYKMDYSNLQQLTPFLSKHLVELYNKAVRYKQRESYETINENLRKLYSNKIGGRKFDSDAVKDEIEKIKKLFGEILSSGAKNNDERLKEKEDYQENRKRILSKAGL